MHFMLSSKKSTLISCLLKRITSDARLNTPTTSTPTSTLRPAVPRRTIGDHQVDNCGNQSTTGGLLWRYLSKCCSADECPSRKREHHQHHQQQYNNTIHIQDTKRLLQSLSKCELRHLWDAIQSGGRHEGECVLVQLPRQKTSSSRRQRHRILSACDEQTTKDQSPMVQQHHDDNTPLFNDELDKRLLVSLRWRWPNLETHQIDEQLLRPLPCCHHYALGHKTWRHIKQHHSVCINPYHWAQLTTFDYSLEDVSSGQVASLSPMPVDNGRLNCQCGGGLIERDSLNNHQYYPMSPSSTPPPSYSEADAGNDALPFVQVACNKHSSMSLEPNVRNNSKWCRVAYWEFRDRVGELFSFSSNSINVSFDDTSEGDSQISLHSLFKSRRHTLPEVVKTRNKIGNGVSIFRDADNSVWLYNRSHCTVFVSSRIFLQSTFHSNGSPTVTIMKVPPGHIIKAYDLKIAQRQRALLNTSTHKSQDRHEFSFSFVKGFGQNYSRQDILQCPCWVEVFLDLTTTAATDQQGAPNA